MEKLKELDEIRRDLGQLFDLIRSIKDGESLVLESLSVQLRRKVLRFCRLIFCPPRTRSSLLFCLFDAEGGLSTFSNFIVRGTPLLFSSNYTPRIGLCIRID